MNRDSPYDTDTSNSKTEKNFQKLPVCQPDVKSNKDENDSLDGNGSDIIDKTYLDEVFVEKGCLIKGVGN